MNAPTKAPAESRTPVCPRCGSEDVQQWDLVPVPYELTSIKPDGSFDTSEGGNSPAYDGATFDEVRCQACDHCSASVLDFYPWRDGMERAQALIDETVRSLDGDVFLVVDTETEDHGETAWVLGAVHGRSIRCRPHEVEVVNA